MKLILLRHGQTEANAKAILQGVRLDSPLTDKGRRQVKDSITKVRQLEVEEIFCSHLVRARETAQIIGSEVSLEIKESPYIHERDLGDLTGRTWLEINDFFGHHMMSHDRGHIYDYRSFGGESADQVRERLAIFTKNIQVLYEGRTVLAVTHKGIIEIYYRMLGIEQPKENENASLHVFEIGSKSLDNMKMSSQLTARVQKIGL